MTNRQTHAILRSPVRNPHNEGARWPRCYEEQLATFRTIPHTFERTNLHTRQPGQRDNLEADVFVKHIARLIGR